MTATKAGPRHRQTGKPDYYTPQRYLNPVRACFGGTIPLDPCTIASNPTRARTFFTPATDGLKRDWLPYGGAFVNPPYGKEHGFRSWLERINDQAARGLSIIALLPCGSRFECAYFQDNVLTEHLDAVCFVRGRIPFERPPGVPQKNNNYGSAFYAYNLDPGVFCDNFWPLGRSFEWILR